jgi:ParB family chromosome partitioning protein
MTPGELFPGQVALIDASVRLRPVDPDRVGALAASMREIGLQQPIIVRPGRGGFVLVAGGHRLEAARLLGWEFIPAILADVGEAQAAIIEIDENLIRHELSALDFAISVARRKALYEALNPQVKHGGRREKNGEATPETKDLDQVANLATWSRFSKDAAKRTGLSERTFQYAAGIMQRLSPEVVALVRATKLAHNGAALKKLSRLPPDAQLAAVQALVAGQARTLAAALLVSGHAEPVAIDPDEALMARFQDLLSRSNATTRRRMLLGLIRHVRSGELPALANALAERLPNRGRKLVSDALAALVDGQEAA